MDGNSALILCDMCGSIFDVDMSKEPPEPIEEGEVIRRYDSQSEEVTGYLYFCSQECKYERFGNVGNIIAKIDSNS